MRVLVRAVDRRERGKKRPYRARRVADQHADAVQSGRKIRFQRGNGGGRLRPAGTRLLGVQRRNQPRLHAPFGNLKRVILRRQVFPRDPQPRLGGPQRHIIGGQFGGDRRPYRVEVIARRSEERRVGKAWVSKCRFRWTADHYKKKKKKK